MLFVRASLLLLIIGIPLAAYVPKRTLTSSGLAMERWADAAFPIVWRLNPNRGGNVSGTRAIVDALREAFQAWSPVATARISFSEALTTPVANAERDGINLISLVPNAYNSTAPSLTILYTVATPGGGQFAGQILEADILFNPEASISTDTAVPADRLDLQSLAVHEIGHLLGLDHSGLASAVMYPTAVHGTIRRALSTDDVIGISSLYPSFDFFSARGSIQGLVRSAAGSPVFGAHVVILDAAGKPVVSAITDSDGSYLVRGLDAGNYSAYAEPMDGPLTASGIQTLGQAFPNQTVTTAFTTRFAVTSDTTSTRILAKTAGDNQTAPAGLVLPQQLEVTLTESNGTPVSGAIMRFAAASGGGAVVPFQAATDTQGKARTTAYLGKGGTQAFLASSGTATVTFTAIAGSSSITSVTFVDSATSTVLREITVNEGSSVQTPLRILDSSGALRTDVGVTYSSLNPEVATVDSAGLVRGVKAGFSTLTVTAGGVVSTATITVVQVQSSPAGAQAASMTQDLADRLYFAVAGEHTIRRADSLTSASVLYAGTAQTSGLVNDLRAQSRFNNPTFLALDQADGTLYVSDSTNHVIRRIRPGAQGRVETLAGAGVAGNQDGAHDAARFNNPRGIAIDSAGHLWVADSGNHTIRRINLSTRVVETIAGTAGTTGAMDGTGTAARFSSPIGVAVETEAPSAQLDRFFRGGAPRATRVIVADSGNGALRRVHSSGQVETLSSVTTSVNALSAGDLVSGKDKPADNVSAITLTVNSPSSVAVDPFGNVYFTESGSDRVRVLLRSGDVLLAAQSNTFSQPGGLAIMKTGRLLVSNGDGSVRQVQYGAPQMTSVSPERMASAGGTSVTIQGSNFSPDTAVIVGGVVVTDAAITNTQTITFTAPANIPSGVTTLTLQNRGGIAQRSISVQPVSLTALQAGSITTVAGGKTFVGDGGPASLAELSGPTDVGIDRAGNVFFTDARDHRVRRIDAQTGLITTVAGTGYPAGPGYAAAGEPATASRLQYPYGIGFDRSGTVFFSDTGSVRQIGAESGSLTTTIKPGAQARFAIDSGGNFFFVSPDVNAVYRINPGTGINTTVVGNGTAGFTGDGGPGAAAQLSSPWDLVIDSANNIYIADAANGRVRKVDATTGNISTFAGGGTGDDGQTAASAKLIGPKRVEIGPGGDVFILDESQGGYRIRKVDAQTNIITTVFTSGTPNETFAFTDPPSFAVDGTGNLIIADENARLIRKVRALTGTLETVAGTGVTFAKGDNQEAYLARLLFAIGHPQALKIDGTGNTFSADLGDDRPSNGIRKINAATGIITTSVQDNYPAAITMDAGNMYVASDGTYIQKVNLSTSVKTTIAGTGNPGFSGDGSAATAAQLGFAAGMAFDPQGNLLILDANNHRIRKVNTQTGIITTVAGSGPANGGFSAGDFSGDGGAATSARLYLVDGNGFGGIAVDPSGNIFIADIGNNRVRKVAATTGIITTVAGNGAAGVPAENGVATANPLSTPHCILTDAAGHLFICSQIGLFDFRVFRVDANTGIITTVAGSTGCCFSGDGGPARQAFLFWRGAGLAFDAAGNLWIADAGNQRIRVVKGVGTPP